MGDLEAAELRPAAAFVVVRAPSGRFAEAEFLFLRMRYESCGVEVVAVLLAGSLLAAPARAGWCPLSKRACGVEGLQSSVVEGIIMVESGGNPWALHVGVGKGYAFYPQSEGEARRYLAVSLALTDNVDIGLMQVNWRTWGKTARSHGLGPYDLLDPQTNLWMGCRILV